MKPPIEDGPHALCSILQQASELYEDLGAVLIAAAGSIHPDKPEEVRAEQRAEAVEAWAWFLNHVRCITDFELGLSDEAWRRFLDAHKNDREGWDAEPVTGALAEYLEDADGERSEET